MYGIAMICSPYFCLWKSSRYRPDLVLDLLPRSLDSSLYIFIFVLSKLCIVVMREEVLLS